MLANQVRLAPPPRRVGLSLRILNGVGHPALWAVFGFTTIFFWTFVANADLSFITFRGPFRLVAAKVIAVEETGASESDTPVMATRYEYSVGGEWFRGVSYSLREGGVVGQNVVVQYLESDPASSRIDGMRRRMFGPAVMVITLFPAVAGFFLAWSIRKGRRRRHLLEHGLVAMGKLTDKRATRVRVNRQTVWELTFEFTGRDGRKHETRARTHQTMRLEDERQEPVLYDPADPSIAFVLDEMPSRPKVDLAGELEGRPLAAALSLILPALVIVGNLAALMNRIGD
ncbi:MAG TPA: hypothetical protein VMS98_09485 [Thermoanaerobaculia bacterium]|nr:hypothetical protein [Thermoanaerobaculia bacterium]